MDNASKDHIKFIYFLTTYLYYHHFPLYLKWHWISFWRRVTFFSAPSSYSSSLHSFLRYRLVMIFIVESGSMEDCVYLQSWIVVCLILILAQILILTFSIFIPILNSAVELCQSFINEGAGTNSGLSVLRTFRLLRILKLVRFMPNLRRQLFVMLRTMDNVAIFFSLLILFIFIFRWVWLFLSF